MRRTAMLVALGGVLAAALPAQDLEKALEAAEALGAHTGIAVADGEGHVLFQRDANATFAPASNQKLLTAAAVLQGLGPDAQFVTRFELRGGKLVVHASGDPNWISGSAHDPAIVFGEVAAALQRLHVAAIRGIELDAGTFRGPSRPATWPQNQLQTYYCAPTGPFVLDQGTFSVGIRAGDGAAATAHVAAPASDVPVRGTIDLVDRAKGAVYGAVDLGDAVQVRGHFFRKASPVTIRVAVADPAVWYEAALRQALGAAGIHIAADAAAPADGPVHEYKTSLAASLLRMLEDSSNFDAEQLLRVLGATVGNDGSLAGGLAVLQHTVAERFGGLPDGCQLVDGSGLSKDNRVTPGLLLAAMQASQRGPGAKTMRESLPIAGRSGTLEERFTKTDLVGRVHAKTGWIRGASALSGYVERRDGSLRWFSILMNYDPKKDGLNKDLKKLQEQMVAAIDRSGTGR